MSTHISTSDSHISSLCETMRRPRDALEPQLPRPVQVMVRAVLSSTVCPSVTTTIAHLPCKPGLATLD
jgi:hypothetical protein